MTTRRRIVAAIILTLALTAQTGCVRMIWSNGKTHGVGVETKALPPTLRVNFLVYRAPTDALYQVYRKAGIGFTQDVMWSFGQPPRVTVYKRCYARYCFAIGEDLFSSRVRSYIYDDPADLRTALIEAAAQRSCLALTLFSNGSTRPNWTKKSSGCRTGSIPGAVSPAAAPLLDVAPVSPTLTGAPASPRALWNPTASSPARNSPGWRPRTVRL